MQKKKAICSYKDIRHFAERQDAEGWFIPYSIRALTISGELIELENVVHIPIKPGDKKEIRRQRRGIRRFKIISSGEIREVYEALIIEIDGVRFLTSISETVYE